MTVQIIENFISEDYANDIVAGASIFLEKPKNREGFFEDPKQRRAIPKEEYHLHTPDERAVDEINKKTDMLISDVLYITKQKLESFYKFPLNNYEGGLVKLVTGAKNGLHSDMYMLDGSSWNDGSGREDELEYSALLYLSDYGSDFTGGDIIFPKQEITIFPKKGMLVFFRGDLEHPHEVSVITGGSRYAMIMFFGK
jgi:hypothetical protein